MNILLVKGGSNYDALSFFVDCLKKSLEKRQHNVILADFSKEINLLDLGNILNSNKIDLAIDFNGIATENIFFDNNNKHMCEVLSFPLLSIYVDHPAAHIQRLQSLNPEYSITSFVDKDNLKYIQELLPHSQKLKFFLPHAGKNINNINTFQDYKKTKTIDILFSGGGRLEAQKPWLNSSSKLLLENMENISNIVSQNKDMSFDEVVKLFNINDISFSLANKAKHHSIFILIDNYFTSIRRTQLIKTLCKNNFNMTVCGGGWGDFFKDYPNVTYVGPTGFEESLKLISQSKIVAQDVYFYNGSHERVFNAMLNNTFVFTDRSKYYDEFFENGKDIAYYKFASLDEDIKILHELLKDDEKLFEMTKNPKQICQTHHTWDNRAKTIEEIYDLIAILDQ